MGMDVYGTDATTEAGKYFRNNVWWWRPLAQYCEKVAPDMANYSRWHSNDGAGLNAHDAHELASILQREVDSGRTESYAKERADALAALPDEGCDLCGGSGIRHDAVMQGGCNKCDGKGKVRPSDTWYPFNVENVTEWIAFLRGCGGFEIW